MSRRSRRGGCPTRKVRYRDRQEAKRALARTRRIDSAKVPVRYFRCDLCNGFHLTSQTDRHDPTRGAYG